MESQVPPISQWMTRSLHLFIGMTLSLCFYSDPARCANLIRNPGAEDGQCADYDVVVTDIPSWTRAQEPQATVGCYGLARMPATCPIPQGCGSKLFYGGPSVAHSGQSELHQTLDISICAEIIDSLQVIATISAYLGVRASQPDDVRVVGEYLNESNVFLGSLEIGPVGDTSTTLEYRENSGTVPSGTRRIRVRQVFRDLNSGTNPAQAYVDNLSLVLSECNVLSVEESTWGRVRRIFR